MSNKQSDHCIIGAGFAGLPIARKFLQLSQSFDILEKSDGVGGIWHHGVYETARLISSKRTTQYPSFPMPDHYPVFPNRDQVRDYLKSYADHFKISEHINFNCEVTSIQPTYQNDQQTGWLVKDQEGKKRTYKTLIIATGHFWQPKSIKVLKNFKGEVVSAANYSHPKIFKDKKILIVGDGNSATDITNDALKYGRSVDISCREGAWILPRDFLGLATSDYFYFSPLKFDFTDRLLAKVISSFSGGNLQDFGLPVACKPILTKHPVVNSEFIKNVRNKKIKIRPEISDIKNLCVHFQDGRSSTYDLIVTAIGYELDLPFLDKSHNFLKWQDDLPILYLNLIAPFIKGLFFAGFAQARTGGGPLFEGYGNLIARMAAFELENNENIYEQLNKLKRMTIAPYLYSVSPLSKLDMRSRGLGELKNGIRLLSSALNKLGCPD